MRVLACCVQVADFSHSTLVELCEFVLRPVLCDGSPSPLTIHVTYVV